jgi:transposase-like protein
MDKRYRTYPQEFKLEALELLKQSGKSAAQLERDLGITSQLMQGNIRCDGCVRC